MYGNRVMMPGLGCAVDPHVIIAMLHVEQKSLREPLRHWTFEQRYELLRSRAAGVDGSEERKAGSARMTRYWPAWRAQTGNSKDGDSAPPRWVGVSDTDFR